MRRQSAREERSVGGRHGFLKSTFLYWVKQLRCHARLLYIHEQLPIEPWAETSVGERGRGADGLSTIGTYGRRNKCLSCEPFNLDAETHCLRSDFLCECASMNSIVLLIRVSAEMLQHILHEQSLSNAWEST